MERLNLNGSTAVVAALKDGPSRLEVFTPLHFAPVLDGHLAAFLFFTVVGELLLRILSLPLGLEALF